MHDLGAVFHRGVHGRTVPDVPGADADPVGTVCVVERSQIEGRHFVALREKFAHEVDPEEAGTTGHENAVSR